MKKELIELKKSWYRLSSIYTRTAEKFNMNPFEFKIYHIIFLLMDDCTQKKLVEYTCEIKQAVNNVVKKFEREGLVTLIVNEKDKRSKKIKLTENGLKLWNEKFDILIKHEEEILKQFSNEEVIGFLNFISKYEKLLEEKTENI